MATRIGIELSPVDCRIVEIDAAGTSPDAPAARVRSIFVSPMGSGETRAQLAKLRGRDVAVVAWGLRGDHRQAIVKAGRVDAMRSEAIASLQDAGINTRGVLTDIAPAGPRVEDGRRRPVVMALAARSDVAAALRPLKNAGIRVRSVATPGAALGSLARLRRGCGAVSGVEAYVSLEENATCIALIRQHVLVGARELPWGYVHEHEPFGERVPREKVAARLADELVDFFSAVDVEPGSVSVVCICGTMPDLRSTCLLLKRRLDLEVEPLDSMFRIVTESLAEDAPEFEGRNAELQLAWAAAADWKAPLNLLREPRQRAMAAVFARVAVVAGVAAGVALGWSVQRTPWLEASVLTPRVNVPAPVATGPETLKPVASTGQLETANAASKPAPIEQPIEHLVGQPVKRLVAQPVERPPAPLAAPPIMHEPIMPVEPAAPDPVAIARVVDEPAPAASVSGVLRAPRRPPPAAAASSLHLGSILFGPDRKLAMIDGRIVEAGDDVGEAMVVEISPTTVTLRDRTGRFQKLSLGGKRQ